MENRPRGVRYTPSYTVDAGSADAAARMHRGRGGFFHPLAVITTTILQGVLARPSYKGCMPLSATLRGVHLAVSEACFSFEELYTPPKP